MIIIRKYNVMQPSGFGKISADRRERKRAMVRKLRMFSKAHNFERYFSMKARFVSNWCFEYSSYIFPKGELNPKDNDGTPT